MEKKVIGIIPARGGSKGLPRKNIRNLAGKPLIAWTIEAAEKSRYIDRLIVSSDDKEIITVAPNWGCEVPFVRPQELAQDTTSSVDTVLHALTKVEEYDYIVLLQPTSPLRNEIDIDRCIEKCASTNSFSCVTVVEPSKSPFWMYYLNEEERITPIISQGKQETLRQNLPKVYALNGAVYVNQCEWLIKNKTFINAETVACVMPQERSVDIDTEMDLLFVEMLMRRFHDG